MGSSAQDSQGWNQDTGSLHSHLEALRKNLLPSLYRGWQNSAPSSCIIEVPIFLLAFGRPCSWLLEAALSSLPCGPLHWKSRTWQLTSSRSRGESLSCLRRWYFILPNHGINDSTTFALLHSLTMRVTFYHVHGSCSHSRGRDYTGRLYQEAELLGAILEFCLPQGCRIKQDTECKVLTSVPGPRTASTNGSHSHHHR